MTNDNFPTFVGHRIAGSKDDRGPRRSVKYDYLLAGNGLFVSAARREFEVCLPVKGFHVQGLPVVTPHIVWHVPAVPKTLLAEIVEAARRSSFESGFREEVFALAHSDESGWTWAALGKERTAASAIADDSHPAYRDACIEIHTHPPRALDFSAQDDRDESGKFRFFGIIADIISPQPLARFRCGVHEHFFQVPADAAAGDGLPDGMIDLNLVDRFRVATVAP